METEERTLSDAVKIEGGSRHTDLAIWIYLLFFASGLSAILYQIVWQRALFSLYGINIQSVTIVVSAFMLGLGLGSLAGGHSRKASGSRLSRSLLQPNWALRYTGWVR